MSCGCKNKPQSQPAPSSKPATSTTGQQTTNNNIQESIKKVVEKYYNKK